MAIEKSEFVWYVAGPWEHKAAVYEIIEAIQAAGWQTCSRWADPENGDIDPLDPEAESKRRTQAIRDVEDCMSADGLIYVNSKRSEGKATELGLSIATLKPIVIIGNREGNIFLNLAIPAFDNVSAALDWLESPQAEQNLDFIAGVQEEHRHEEALAWLAEQNHDVEVAS